MARTLTIAVALVLSFALGVWIGKSHFKEDPKLDPRASTFYMPWDVLVNDHEPARIAAGDMLQWWDDQDISHLHKAKQQFMQLQKGHNFGGEYGTLVWMATYLASTPAGQAAMTKDDPTAARIVRAFEANRWMRLKNYIELKYGFKPAGKHLRILDELIRFNSPVRKAWERSNYILDKMNIQPGDHIADVGAGAGFFSFLFADKVGPSGRVIALDLNTQHLAYIDQAAKTERLSQIEVTTTDGTEVGAAGNSLDFVFLCAAYQAVYAFEREDSRTALLNNIKTALKTDGKLVIVDNTLDVPEGTKPYHGILISQKAATAQLEAHGFKLLDASYAVPQRYVLVFEKAD